MKDRGRSPNEELRFALSTLVTMRLQGFSRWRSLGAQAACNLDFNVCLAGQIFRSAYHFDRSKFCQARPKTQANVRTDILGGAQGEDAGGSDRGSLSLGSDCAASRSSAVRIRMFLVESRMAEQIRSGSHVKRASMGQRNRWHISQVKDKA
jgi:hypothetical protein